MHEQLEAIKKLSPRYRFLSQLRENWGNFIDKYRDRNDISLLFDLTKPAEKGLTVNDTTWSDLDMDGLYDRIDTNITPIGRQYLYRQLRTLNTSTSNLQRQALEAKTLKHDKNLRESIQMVLYTLRRSAASRLTEMLFGSPPMEAFPREIAYGLAFSVPTTAFLAAFSLVPFWVPLVFVLFNFLFAQYYSFAITRYAQSFIYLKCLLYCAKQLAAINTGTAEKAAIEPLRSLKKNTGTIKKLRRKTRSAGIDSSGAGDIISTYWAYFLNLLCLHDFLIFIKSCRLLAKHRDDFIQVYNDVASLDAAISVASYTCQLEETCHPTFVDQGAMAFADIKHPLLSEAVPNSYISGGKSALITGSNMAGKTTFIKTIGVNLILAQSLYICRAKTARVPRGPVFSSIKRSDSLADGKSYYLQEIEDLLGFVETTPQNQQGVFLIDEILRGTNTTERLAASTAILEVLGGKGTVFVTTHDTELCDLLPDQYELYHFQETSDFNRMFDYKLHKGRITSRNAINLLAHIGFPDSVVDRARRVAASLD